AINVLTLLEAPLLTLLAATVAPLHTSLTVNVYAVLDVKPVAIQLTLVRVCNALPLSVVVQPVTPPVLTAPPIVAYATFHDENTQSFAVPAVQVNVNVLTVAPLTVVILGAVATLINVLTTVL